jgi:hypothetical protein
MTESVFKTSDWPRCPTCGGRALVIGGPWIGCSSCSFLGAISATDSSPVLDQARARIASKGGGDNVVAMMVAEGAEFDSNISDEIRIEISRRLAHERVWRITRQSLNGATSFAPACVMNYHASDQRYMTLPAGSPIELVIAEKAALTHDVVSVMWISKSPQTLGFRAEDAEVRPVGERGFFNVHTHFYGGSTLVMSSSFRRDGKKLKFGNPEFHNAGVASWCSQPVCWQIVPCVPGYLQPRFLSLRYFTGGVSVNACLCENLDGLPMCNIAIRLGSDKGYDVIPVEAAGVKAGISNLNQKVEDMDRVMLEQRSVPVSAKTVTWPADTDPRLVQRTIRELEVWKHAIR